MSTTRSDRLVPSTRMRTADQGPRPLLLSSIASPSVAVKKVDAIHFEKSMRHSDRTMTIRIGFDDRCGHPDLKRNFCSTATFPDIAPRSTSAKHRDAACFGTFKNPGGGWEGFPLHDLWKVSHYILRAQSSGIQFVRTQRLRNAMISCRVLKTARSP